MPVLLDTGILLRLPNREDVLHHQVWTAVRGLRSAGERLVTTLQSMSEFWNVCTRPASSRGGLGLTSTEAHRRLRIIERSIPVLPEPPGLYARWREVVLTHRVLGVQVHDAKLAAAMSLHGITQLLTMNGRDFVRYPNIRLLSP